MKKFILFIFSFIIIYGCNQKSEHPPTTFNLSFDTNNRHFDQHKLTITAIYLLNSSGSLIPLLHNPQTIDFGKQINISHFIDKEIPPGEYTKMLINIDTIDAKVIQTQISDNGTIKENTYNLTLISTTGDKNNSSDITLSLTQPINIKPFSRNTFVLFYDASQSLALPKDTSDTQSLLFSPLLKLFNLSDEIKDSNKKPIEKEINIEPIGKIYSFTNDTVSIKVNGEIKNIDLNNIKLVSSIDETFPVTDKNIHIGQYVIFQEVSNELILMPSTIIAEVPNLPDKVRRFPFDIFSINDLSFNGVFNTPTLDIDFLYLNTISLSNLNEALIAFKGYLDTTEGFTFTAFDYYLIPFDAVNVSMTFNNENKEISLHEETSGHSVFALTGDALSSAITFMTLKDIDIPLERIIKKIHFLSNTAHTIKHLNNSGADLSITNTSTLYQTLQDKFNSESHLSSLHIKGHFDYKTHILTAESTTFMFTKRPNTQTSNKITSELTISEDVKTSIIIAAGSIAVGIFSIAVVVSLFAHRTGHVRDQFFKKFEGIDDKTMKDLTKNLKKLAKTTDTSLTIFNENSDELIKTIKSVGEIAEDIEGHGITFGRKKRKTS